MITKTDEEIIGGILDICARESKRLREMSHLIRLSINDKDGAEDIDTIRFAVENKITEEGLLTKHGAGWGANSKTHEIMNAGGYVNYITKVDRRAKLRERGEDAKYNFDIFVLKNKWLPYAISGGALIISILAFLQSGGWICLFKS